MIPLSLGEIAKVVGGTIEGDGGTGEGGGRPIEGDDVVMVTAPAVLDGRAAEPGGLFVAVAGEHVDGHDYAGQAGRAGAVAVLGSRPTSLPTVAVADVQAALQSLAAHVVARLRDGLIVVGLTSSQGKTGTKDLLAAVLSRAAPTIATIGSLNNELGVPLTMLRADPATRFLVLEMGARHVGDIAKLTDLVAPDIAVVLNVGQAHIGEFGSRGAIAKAKGELVRGLAPGGTAVLNADDPRVVAMRSLTDGPVLTFGQATHADVRVLDLKLDRLGRPSFTLRTAGASVRVALPFVGAHQARNAAAAAAAGLAAGVSLDVAAAALATASLSKWRMELRDLAGGGAAGRRVPRPVTTRAGCTVRVAEPGDAAQVAALLAELGYPDNRTEDVRRRLAMWEREAACRALVAERQGQVAGVIAVAAIPYLEREGRRGRIVALVVSEACRGQGIGRRLVDAAEKAAGELDCIAMEVTSSRSRAQSHPFYRNLGYEDGDGRSARYVKDLVPGDPTAPPQVTDAGG